MLRALQFQIYAYQKFKDIDHQPPMDLNLEAIRDECAQIAFIIRDMRLLTERAETAREAEVAKKGSNT